MPLDVACVLSTLLLLAIYAMLSFKMCGSRWGEEGVQWVICFQTFPTVFEPWWVTAGSRIHLGKHRGEKHVHQKWGTNPKSALRLDVQVPDLLHVPLSTCTCEWTVLSVQMSTATLMISHTPYHSCVTFLELTVQICPGFSPWNSRGGHC